MPADGPVRATAALLAVLLTGCVSRGPAMPSAAEAGVPVRLELEQTPFFPQVEYECGPAALATVLAASGLRVVPDDIAPEVYLPGRRGSLQPELLASARRRGRLPYVLPGSLETVVQQVAAGFPVLVLQKLGAGPWPGWHYAVVVGYDLDSGNLQLRSGTDRRLEMSAHRFMMSWDRAERWAVVVLRPGELPASAQPGRYMEAAASLESVGEVDAARDAYLAAAGRWPQDPLTRIALGNVALARGELEAAERAYAEAVHLDRQNVPARNNLAEVLLRRGCPTAARAEIEAAARLAAGGPYATAVADTAGKIASVHGPDHPGCPLPEAE
jgi:hypothetical protein